MFGPLLGVILHAIGGLAAGSFYIPYKKVRGWSWETYWLVGGFFSWIIVPWVVSVITVPGTVDILASAPRSAILWSFFYGVLWGIGGLTFGLSMRYLGLSLGYALALGNCAAFGTLIPPIYDGITKGDWSKFTTVAGWVILFGIFVCLVGIAICGRAGVFKEREMSAEAKKESIREFNFKKGFWVAIFAGVMSACMSFAIAAGDPIAKLAASTGAPALWVNGPVFIVIMAGGFLTNLIWCVYLHATNKTGHQYTSASEGGSVALNYFFSALAGTIWYMQFMFYGMGTTQLKGFEFSSWTLHMAFIIIFSNMWALAFKEWAGASPRTMRWIYTGIGVLIVSTIIVGVGNYLGQPK